IAQISRNAKCLLRLSAMVSSNHAHNSQHVRAATVADTLPDRVSPSPAAATLNRNRGRAVPRLDGMGREITNLPMLRQVIDIGIENKTVFRSPLHNSKR